MMCDWWAVEILHNFGTFAVCTFHCKIKKQMNWIKNSSVSMCIALKSPLHPWLLAAVVHVLRWVEKCRRQSRKWQCRNEWRPLPPCGCLWCGTCWVLEAVCLEVVYMLQGLLMSCGPCYYQWDQSWKWTATCNMMMTTHSHSDSIGCQSQTWTNQS